MRVGTALKGCLVSLKPPHLRDQETKVEKHRIIHQGKSTANKTGLTYIHLYTDTARSDQALVQSIAPVYTLDLILILSPSHA